jgi:phosphatidylglycerol:prolipoprotein diacylglycerol transferase
MIGIIAGCWLYGRRYKRPFLHLVDITALSGSLGVFFGRVANFINAELPGRPVESAISWAVKFPHDILSWPASAPERLTQLTPAAQQVGVPADIWQRWIATLGSDSASYQSINLVLQKIFSAAQAGNAQIIEILTPLLIARHPSQLYAAALEGILVFLILLFVARRPRPQGFLTAIFFLAYPLARIFDEQFRMPDIQIGFQALGLTRGQWLSIAMFIPGVLFLLWSKRQTDKTQY